ncbi:hypothetical protein WM42_2264 [Corynebacterium simulans]|nr:hypothetical protein WM42_2264 [Corynebacterium simulans]
MWYPAKVVSVTNPQMNSEQAKNEEIAALLEGEWGCPQIVDT